MSIFTFNDAYFLSDILSAYVTAYRAVIDIRQTSTNTPARAMHNTMSQYS